MLIIRNSLSNKPIFCGIRPLTDDIKRSCHMYNKQLETFLKVADEGNFSKAASALYVSSSAVIQQINHLERDLGVALFERGRYGVRLTEAGTYLAEEAKSYIRKGIQIRKNLLHISSKTNTLCIGSAHFQKVRLLYDFWAMFSHLGKKFDIRLVNIENPASAEHEVELIESVKVTTGWLDKWEFLNLCNVRTGCAVARHHALAGRPFIRYEDLAGWTLYCQSQPGMAHPKIPGGLYDDLRCHSIIPEQVDAYHMDLMWRCACEPCALITPMCWQDIMPDMVILPFEKEYLIPYGFYYRRDISEAAREFLDFIISLYNGRFPDLPLPVLPASVPVTVR